MKRVLTIFAGLALLAACSKSPSAIADAALAKGDLAGALAQLDAAVAAKNEDPKVHALRYVVARQLSLTGPEAGKSAALNKSIAEFEWLATHFKIPKDYTNSDASLRANAPIAALLEEAGKSVFR